LLNGEEASLAPANRTPRLLRLIANYPRATATNARAIVVTPYDDQQRFQRSHMGSVLTWGLKRKGIDWILHNPANGKPEADGFDAVLCWPYGFRESPGFLRNCIQFERSARQMDLPVINSLAGCDFRHTWCLRLWAQAGIPCANYQRLRPGKDIQLKYPLILRTDALHRGLNMFFVRDPEEARRVLQLDITPPLDLALEFIDTQAPDGFFRKWRSHVIGNKVIPRQAQLSKTWKVNLDAARLCGEALEEDRRFISAGEPHAGLVALAARALRSDIIALDYSKTSDGSYIFWEGNRNFDLSVGGQMWWQFRRTTGRPDEECVESVRLIGDAIGELIVARARRR
jgi:hypothetical protein